VKWNNPDAEGYEDLIAWIMRDEFNITDERALHQCHEVLLQVLE
jgi:hypothetical protein